MEVKWWRGVEEIQELSYVRWRKKQRRAKENSSIFIISNLFAEQFIIYATFWSFRGWDRTRPRNSFFYDVLAGVRVLQRVGSQSRLPANRIARAGGNWNVQSNGGWQRRFRIQAHNETLKVNAQVSWRTFRADHTFPKDLVLWRQLWDQGIGSWGEK